MKFLIVDDNPENAERDKFFLSEWKPESIFQICHDTTSALKILDVYSHDLPNLVVVDLWYRTGLDHSFQPGIDFLTEIMLKYNLLNIMVHSSDPMPIVQVLRQVEQHRGGFTIFDNVMEDRDTFIRRAEDSLEGDIRVYRKLREMNQDFNLDEQQIQILKMVCEDCLRNNEIANKLYCHTNSIVQKVRILKDILLEVEIDEKLYDSRMLLCNSARKYGYIQ